MITSNVKLLHPVFFVSILFAAIMSIAACSDLYDIEEDLSNSIIKGESLYPSSNEYRKLFPRLVEKFKTSDIHYITYDGKQIDNTDLQSYVDQSASFLIKGIKDDDPLFGKFEYQVFLSSPEQYEKSKIAQEKWRKEWYKTFRIVTPEGDTVLYMDALKLKEKYGIKIDSSRYNNGVSALTEKGAASISFGKNQLLRPKGKMTIAGVDFKIESYKID